MFWKLRIKVKFKKGKNSLKKAKQSIVLLVGKPVSGYFWFSDGLVLLFLSSVTKKYHAVVIFFLLLRCRYRCR